MEKLVIFGVSGFAREVSYFVEKYKLYEVIGYCVDDQYHIPDFMGKPVYKASELDSCVDKIEVTLFIGISWYNYLNKYKRQKFEYFKEKGFKFANLISPLASVNCSKIGEGNWIQDFAYIGFETTLGDNNTFCCHSIIGHFSTMQSHNVLSGKAYIAGNVNVGNQNFFGLNSVVFNKLNVGDKNLIGGNASVKQSLGTCNIVTAPESCVKKVTEKVVELCLSPKSVEIVNNVL